MTDTPKVIKKEKIDEKEIDKRIEALSSVMSHWGWKTFVETIQYMQGGLQLEVFSTDFEKLDPVAKDKRHASIVEALRQLDRILHLPEWLARRKPSRWEAVTQP